MFNLGSRAVGRRMGHTRAASGSLLPYLSAADVVFMGCTGGFGTYSLFGFALGQNVCKWAGKPSPKTTLEILGPTKTWKYIVSNETAAEWLGFLYNAYNHQEEWP